jgi:protease II
LLSRRSARREEWGNPAEEKFFDYMLSYSPINNVAAQAYPALLITAGLNDPRVAYWEPAKWTATLRDLKTDDNPLLLKVRSSFCTAPSREELGGYTREKERTLPT